MSMYCNPNVGGGGGFFKKLVSSYGGGAKGYGTLGRKNGFVLGLCDPIILAYWGEENV